MKKRTNISFKNHPLTYFYQIKNYYLEMKKIKNMPKDIEGSSRILLATQSSPPLLSPLQLGALA